MAFINISHQTCFPIWDYEFLASAQVPRIIYFCSLNDFDDGERMCGQTLLYVCMEMQCSVCTDSGDFQGFSYQIEHNRAVSFMQKIKLSPIRCNKKN